MQPSIRRWHIDPEITPEADLALQKFDPVLRQILFNRGYATEEKAYNFLNAIPDFDSNPFQLKDMQIAVQRIAAALKDRNAIAIYGDYDVDGVSATALLVLLLLALDANVQGYIPNRFEEGYGVNKDALTTLKERGIQLVITVDCGIRSLPEAQHAHELGLDLIITDHHHPSGELPLALAIINPKQPGDAYPDKDLAGVGLAYKLGAALLQHLAEQNFPFTREVKIEDYLDLVALGTVADLAPLVGENRSLVRAGLNSIRKVPRQGLHSLIGVAGIHASRVVASDIGFIIGPRLNAAGRLESALDSFKLLTTTSVAEAGMLAQQLDTQNRERQKITRTIQSQAEEIALAQDPDVYLLMAAHPEFNPGVIGLAASRLTDLYYRPAIVAHQGEEFTRGSCRSIPEFHITDALDMCTDLLEHHGGHAAAAGFTIRNEHLPELVTRLQEIARSQLSEQTLAPILHADMEIPLSDLRPELLEELEQLQPTGYGSPQAVFVSRNLKVINQRTVGKDASHLKLAVTDGWVTYDAIAFRQGNWAGRLPKQVDLLYTFEKNEYNGLTSLQLNVRDIKPADILD